jgi:hypothetical protein
LLLRRRHRFRTFFETASKSKFRPACLDEGAAIKPKPSFVEPLEDNAIKFEVRGQMSANRRLPSRAPPVRRYGGNPWREELKGYNVKTLHRES